MTTHGLLNATFSVTLWYLQTKWKANYFIQRSQWCLTYNYGHHKTRLCKNEQATNQVTIFDNFKSSEQRHVSAIVCVWRTCSTVQSGSHTTKRKTTQKSARGFISSDLLMRNSHPVDYSSCGHRQKTSVWPPAGCGDVDFTTQLMPEGLSRCISPPLKKNK